MCERTLYAPPPLPADVKKSSTSQMDMYRSTLKACQLYRTKVHLTETVRLISDMRQKSKLSSDQKSACVRELPLPLFIYCMILIMSRVLNVTCPIHFPSVLVLVQTSQDLLSAPSQCLLFRVRSHIFLLLCTLIVRIGQYHACTKQVFRILASHCVVSMLRSVQNRESKCLS